jgi:DNA-binding transcriptional MerR regulator
MALHWSNRHPELSENEPSGGMIMAGPNIRRLYYTMSEVCSRIGISEAALRNWEHRFPGLKPARSQAGRKLYRPGDLKLALRLKQLKEADYTDEEIESMIWPHMQHAESPAPQKSKPDAQIIEGIRDELKEILALIDPDVKRSASN